MHLNESPLRDILPLLWNDDILRQQHENVQTKKLSLCIFGPLCPLMLGHSYQTPSFFQKSTSLFICYILPADRHKLASFSQFQHFLWSGLELTNFSDFFDQFLPEIWLAWKVLWATAISVETDHYKEDEIERLSLQNLLQNVNEMWEKGKKWFFFPNMTWDKLSFVKLWHLSQRDEGGGFLNAEDLLSASMLVDGQCLSWAMVFFFAKAFHTHSRLQWKVRVRGYGY